MSTKSRCRKHKHRVYSKRVPAVTFKEWFDGALARMAAQVWRPPFPPVSKFASKMLNVTP